MKHRVFLSILVDLVSLSCMSAAFAMPPDGSARGGDPTAGITSILMHRSGCYGFCPVYEVQVTAQGVVAFDGHRFVQEAGKHNRRIDPRKFQQLARLVNKIGFFQLQDRYRYEQDGCGGWVTDNPTVDITVAKGPSKKQVSYYYGCRGPDVADQLIALSEAIDQVTGTSAWIGNGGRSSPTNRSVK